MLRLCSATPGAEARVPLAEARLASRTADSLLDAWDGAGAADGAEPELPIPAEIGSAELAALASLLAAGAGARAEIAALDAALEAKPRERPPTAELRRLGAAAVVAYAERVPSLPPLGAASALRIASAAEFLDAPAALWSAVDALAPILEALPAEEARDLLVDGGAPPGVLYDLYPSTQAPKLARLVREIAGESRPPPGAASAGVAICRSMRSTLAPLNAFQREALRRALEGRNLFVTGPGGTGKSFVLSAIREGLPRFDRALGIGAAELRDEVCVVAPTAAAARLVGGSTIHSFFRIHPDHPCAEDVRAGLNRRRERTKFLPRVYAFDEISMVQPDLFDAVERGAANAAEEWADGSGSRSGSGSRAPFGGAQVILFGDLLQLAPVDRRSAAFSTAPPRLVLDAAAWRAGGFDRPEGVVALRESVRHSGDAEFDALLAEVRLGTVSPRGLALLASRVGARPPEDGIVATRILVRNDDVDAVNAKHLALLPAETEVAYECRDWHDPGTFAGKAGAAALGELFSDRCRAPRRIVLRKGAQVVFNVNRAVPEREHSVINGTRGVVAALAPSSVTVRLVDGTEVRVHAHAYHLASTSVLEPEPCWRHPFGPCSGCTLRFRRVTLPTATRHQIPLALAWATTVHRSQGQTIDRAVVSLGGGGGQTGRAFPGIAYVTLSRVRSSAALFIDSIDPAVIRSDPRAVAFYRAVVGEGASSSAAAPPARVCACGRDAACALGPSGEPHYRCVDDRCDYFEAVRGVVMGPAAAACLCRIPTAAVVRTASGSSSCPGRLFAVCPREGVRRCTYFRWIAGAKRPRAELEVGGPSTVASGA